MMLTLIAMPTNMACAAENTNTASAVAYTSIQEPSIVVGYIDVPASHYTKTTKVYDTPNESGTSTKMYFVFGSHRAWAYSFDLMSWTSFTNNIDEDYSEIFAEDAVWSAKGGAQGSDTKKYEVSDNLRAPHVIWNPDMGKWCMYMSVNGDCGYASVVLLTSDSLNGDWERVGTVVYSGFSNANDAGQTDYFKVTGTDGNRIEWDDRYTAELPDGKNPESGVNVMEPNVFYDDGNLWMAYGSWLGGVYMLKLDASTGLRDYATSYALLENTSDPYMGYKLAEGQDVSGEVPYIEKIGEYYYLFLNDGGLTADGGTDMRVFRSESVTGPYKDESGDGARYAVGADDATLFVNEDGKVYVISQTRANDGTEESSVCARQLNDGTGESSVRAHQLYVTKSGWLAAAPLEYIEKTLTRDIMEGNLMKSVTEKTLTKDIAGEILTKDITEGSLTKDVEEKFLTKDITEETLQGTYYKDVPVGQYIDTGIAAAPSIGEARPLGDKKRFEDDSGNSDIRHWKMSVIYDSTWFAKKRLRM